MKNYTVEVLLTAEKEIKKACDWYEEQQTGLSIRFLNEVDHYFELIARNPFHFPIRFKNIYHTAVLHKFPYIIVFRVDERRNIVFVNSVFHTSHNPAKFE